MNFLEVTVLAASSSDGEGSSWFALLFLLTGPAYFFVMYNRYRNASKRHLHEKETLAEIANLTGTDVKIKSVTGSSNPSMNDSNHQQVNG